MTGPGCSSMIWGCGDVGFRRQQGMVHDTDVGFSAWLVAVLRCCTLPGEQVALPCDELLDGFRGQAGDFLDRGGHAVIPILAM